MNSTWKSLLWKEWREQRWRLVALTILLAMPAMWFFVSITARAITPVAIGDYLSLFTAFVTCYVILAGCFLGMNVAGGENARHTMRYMQALPTPMWQAALVKILVGWFVAVLPLLISFCAISAILPFLTTNDMLSQAIGGMRGRFGHLENTYEWSLFSLAIGGLGVSSLLLWMASGGVNRSDEVRAGAIGFLACIAVWLPSLYLYDKVDQFSHFLGEILQLLVSSLPGGPAFIPAFYLEGTNLRGWFLIVPALVLSHSAVLAWYLKRFGRVAAPPKHTGEREFNFFHWRTKNTSPMRSPLQAIAWKQLRETGPVAALVIAGIMLIVPIIYYFNSQTSSLSYFGELLQGVTLSASFFVLIVAGIGVFLEDFAPRVNNFWRSRPINLNLWFVVKYLVGLLLLGIAFGSLLILAHFLESGFDLEHWQLRAALAASYALALLYTLSMASYCLLRQPIYAAVVTFGIFIVGMISMDWLFPKPSYILSGTVSMSLAMTIPLIVSYLAVKHDWGWKVGR